MHRWTLVLATAVCAGRAMAQTCPQTTYPGDEWSNRAEDVRATKAAAVAELDAYAFTRTGTDENRVGVRTEGALVVHAGEIVYERYASGWDAGKRHLSWSVAKSVTSALTGIGVREGVLSVDDSVCRHFPVDRADVCDRLKISHLLDHASGLNWAEVYENASNQSSSTLAMLYGVGKGDMPRFVATQGFAAAPGSQFQYTTGGSTLLLGVVQKAFERAGRGKRFAWELLFEPLGMRRVVFERDVQGNLAGGSYVYATPRDYARFGYLYLRDGCWNGQRILPEGWVTFSQQVPNAFLTARLEADAQSVPGRQWWTNRQVPGLVNAKPYPDVPDDAFFAIGHWGQYIAVIPSRDVVAVRVGDDRDSAFDLNEFLKRALEVAR